MTKTKPIEKIQSELKGGMKHSKCRKCGCMKDALENLQISISALQSKSALILLDNIKQWLERMEPIRYACLGCNYCIHAKAPAKINMDRAGYFVIIPQPQKKTIVVEHYTYDNLLRHIIEGKDARSIYHTIIEQKWVTQLDHAAYLGKELMKAELSIKIGFHYIQDGA